MAKEAPELWEEKPHLSLDFPRVAANIDRPVSIPVDSQEWVLAQDMITCLLCRNGDYAAAIPGRFGGPVEFAFSPEFAQHLVARARKILVVASHYSSINTFVQNCHRLSAGRVNQALGAAIHEFLNHYRSFILELDHKVANRDVNLQELWQEILPVLESLTFLDNMVQCVGSRKGGATLTVLHEILTNSTGSTMFEVCQKLVRMASKPFMESVQKWVTEGVVFDPFGDFMIAESGRCTSAADEYWNRRFVLRSELVPAFLATDDLAKRILSTGKYLDAAGSCSAAESRPTSNNRIQLEYTLDGEGYRPALEDAYIFASKQLLDILVKDYNVIDRIKSVKRYFLCEQGDFLIRLFDLCGEELNKNISDILPARFAALVDLAVRIPSTSDDAYRDAISLNLRPIGLLEQVIKILSINTDEERRNRESSHALTGVEAFCLSLESSWPVSLIFNKKVMSCYQMLFRHLVYTKWIERMLHQTWAAEMASKRNPHSRESSMLRHRLIRFVQNAAYYMMTEAIEPLWAVLTEEMQGATSVDDLLRAHWVFVDACVKDCLLADVDLLRSYRTLLTVCQHFVEAASAGPMSEKVIRTLDDRFQTELHIFLRLACNQTLNDSSSRLYSLLHRFENHLVPHGTV